jgi:hypothetical protein
VAAEYEVNIKINTQQIERELGKVDKAVKNIGKAKGGSRASGLGLMPNDELKRLQQSRIYLGQSVQSIDRLAKIQDKRARLLNKINELESKGLNVHRLRRQLVKATTEQSKRRLGSAEKEFRILEKNLRLEQSKLRILREQQKGFPSSPIRGARTMMGSPAQIAASGRQAADPIRGRADLVGSPAYYEAQQKAIDRLARQGGPSDPVKGHANLVGSPKYFEEQQKAIDKAARQGGARSPLKGSKDLVGSPAYFDHLNREISRLARQGGATSPVRGNKDLIGSPAYYEHQRKELEKLARKGGPRSSIRGGANMPGSPLALQEGMNRLGQVGLGAGFPLLFGGGPGSVIGGGLGGLTGSFGAQIALSAAGQQIDQLIERTVASAESLTSVGTALDFLRERSLFSSKESEQLARKLENQGDLTGIATLVTEELNEALGPDGIQKMQDLAEETRLAKEQWGQLTTNLELLIAGPLTEFLKIVNATLGIKVAQSQFARSFSRLQEKDPERLKGLLPSFEGAKDPAKAIASNLAFGPNMAGGVFNMQGLSEGALISFTEQINSIIKGMGTPDGSIPITEEDRKRFKPKVDRGALRAEREEARIQKRLGRLEEERKKVFEISRFKDKIAAAEASQDKQLVIRLKGEQQIAEIEAKRKQDLVDITDQRLIDQININAATEKLAAHRDTERELVEFQKTSAQERFDLMQKHIEQQYELNEAVKQQAALAEGIAQTLGQGMAQSFDALIDGAQSWGAALQDIAANVLRDIAKQLIQIYVIEQAVGFLRAYLTPFSPLTPLGAGGGQVGRFGTLGPNYGVPQFANGGNPPVGRPSIVGERGPELFVPRTAGTIVPNHAMGGANVVVNVDASGSSAQGDGQQAKALGSAIGAAVQAELIKQKRPGGLLAS